MRDNLNEDRDAYREIAENLATYRIYGLGRSNETPRPTAYRPPLYPVLLEAYAGNIATHTRMYPGAVDAVIALRSAGYATAICTNKPEALAVALIARLGVTGLFGALIGADTLPQRKPDAAPYLAAVARAGGDVARSMLLGDTETDRKTGRAAGVPVALVTFGPEGQGVARLEPEALLDHYDDLPGLAGRLLG